MYINVAAAGGLNVDLTLVTSPLLYLTLVTSPLLYLTLVTSPLLLISMYNDIHQQFSLMLFENILLLSVYRPELKTVEPKTSVV